MTPTERQEIAARLDGYLDALASVDGRFREHVMGAQLLDLAGRSPESVLADHFRSNEHHSFAIASMTRGESWTEVEAFLRQNVLRAPVFGVDDADGRDLEKTRFELAFQASDMVMFLSPSQSPRGIHHLVLTESKALSCVGCAVEYESDLTLPLGTASHNRRHYAARFSWAASQACSNCIGLT